MSNWQHRGGGSAERTLTIVSVIVIVAIVIWRVAVLFGG